MLDKYMWFVDFVKNTIQRCKELRMKVLIIDKRVGPLRMVIIEGHDHIGPVNTVTTTIPHLRRLADAMDGITPA